MFSSGPQSADTGGGGSLGWGGWEKGVGVFQAVIGKESREGERGLPLQLGFKGLLPGTKLKMDGSHQNLPYILASVTASDSAGFIALVLVYICVSANLCTGSYVRVVNFLFVLKSQTEAYHRQSA